jgi:hypothetical protein
MVTYDVEEMKSILGINFWEPLVEHFFYFIFFERRGALFLSSQ